MIKESNFTKYVLYALGEIILVVIGILIALQINTHRENLKKRAYEVNILTEISSALDYDATHYERMKTRLLKLDSATNVFLRHIHNKTKVFEDTLYREGGARWYYLRTGILYQYNSGPYEALKSSGLEKISNKTLRNDLIKFYDFTFPFNAEMITYSENRYEPQIAKLKSFLGQPFTKEVNGKIEVYQKFPTDLFENLEFLQLVNDINSRANYTIRQIDNHLPKIRKMNDDIKKELNRQ